jgi:hypothetical protein
MFLGYSSFTPYTGGTVNPMSSDSRSTDHRINGPTLSDSPTDDYSPEE